MALHRGTQASNARSAGEPVARPQFHPEIAQAIVNQMTPAELRELALRRWSSAAHLQDERPAHSVTVFQRRQIVVRSGLATGAVGGA